MPGKLQVQVVEARNLPVMDRSAETTDAYVEIHFAGDSYKTDVCAKSLSPHWNSEWFIFEVDEQQLHDDCLQFRIMDYDTYSANDSIGRVYCDLNVLLSVAVASSSSFESSIWTHHSSVSGWLPIYDTLNGHRGELRVDIRLELFTDSTKPLTSALQIFVGSDIPDGYRLQEVHGFVQDLLTTTDPEYQWLDRIRTPRATNESRQFLLRRSLNEMTSNIGRKAFELGANAILGYQQCVDVEGETSDLLVLRALGTAVTLTPVGEIDPIPLHTAIMKIDSTDDDDPMTPRHSSVTSRTKSTPRCNSVNNSRSSTMPHRQYSLRNNLDSSIGLQQNSYSRKYPLLTIDRLPRMAIKGTGASVCARSVRLLADAQEHSNAADIRNRWWAELRWEIRSQMKLLGCNAVLGYREQLCQRDGVCILSCIGTAVIVCDTLWTSSTEDDDASAVIVGDYSKCALCHVTYDEENLPFPISVFTCSHCSKSKCPDFIVSTLPVPTDICTAEKATPIQTSVVRKLTNTENDDHMAIEISHLLPFVEHELHNNLLAESRAAGGANASTSSSSDVRPNALFLLRTTMSLGDGMLVATATALAVTLLPLLSSSNAAIQHRRTLTKSAATSISTYDQKKLTSVIGGGSTAKNPVIDATSTDVGKQLLRDVRRFSWGSMRDAIRLSSARLTDSATNAANRSPPLNVIIERKVWHRRGLTDNTVTTSADTSADGKRVKRRLDRLVEKLRRRHHDKEHFACAIFEHRITLALGVVDEERASNLFGLHLISNNTSAAANQVLISTAEHIADGCCSYLAHYDSVFIRETLNLREVGGLDAFIRIAFEDVLRAVQQQIIAYGGHALLSTRLIVSELTGSLAKNQAQCILAFAGDIVQFRRVPDW